jgi:hypothetical protein
VEGHRHLGARAADMGMAGAPVFPGAPPQYPPLHAGGECRPAHRAPRVLPLEEVCSVSVHDMYLLHSRLVCVASLFDQEHDVRAAALVFPVTFACRMFPPPLPPAPFVVVLLTPSSPSLRYDPPPLPLSLPLRCTIRRPPW